MPGGRGKYELSQIQARIKRCRIYTGITANVVARLVAKRSGTLCNQDHMQTAGPMSAFLNGRGPISEQRVGIDGDGLVVRLHRVFAIDRSRCPRCGGSSQVIAAIPTLASSRASSSTLAWMGVSGRAHRRRLWRADANDHLRLRTAGLAHARQSRGSACSSSVVGGPLVSGSPYRRPPSPWP